ncbi:hypothetical protein [Paludibacterium purpuratum]|uniref:Lipoprotein n=1 Tax=Paludibacterium purpuratum TaxID=1144873 RepID=A0A4V3DUK9_9NEIS|nr:hypothetical protein [Paludibacterium purpuratum]TDR73800.1 hypothetical protein DFP86_1124 [Paludibacterium purpuratum]
MENLRTIWKFHSRSILMAVFLFASATASACTMLGDGVFVADDDSDSLQDGGRLERVISQINSKGIQQKYWGTTANFSYAFVGKNGKFSVFRTISNAIDEKYESLNVYLPAVVKLSCSGDFSIEYVVTNYYTSPIKIGAEPKSKPKKSPDTIKAKVSGHATSAGNIFVSKCDAFEMNNGLWEKTTDDLGVCQRRNFTMFNVMPYVSGKKGWEIN